MDRQEFRVRDLPTRSVTLFPAQAQVVRDIKGVVLQPGVNQIVVVGFTPTVDENSFKVEGTGAAIISNLAVELLPNRDVFEDTYPDDPEDDDNESDDDDSDDTDSIDSDVVPPKITVIRNKIQELQDQIQYAEEMVASASSRLEIVEAYGKLLDRKRGVDVGLEKYNLERIKAFHDKMDGTKRAREYRRTLLDYEKNEARECAAYEKTQRKKLRQKERKREARRKEQLKTAQRQAAARNEKRRIREEREKYWPRKCYTLRITLDVPSFFTPSSSRRSSVSSVTELAKPVVVGAADENATGDADGDAVSIADPDPTTCNLAISYVTSAAFWKPSYDMQLSTTDGTGQLCFDAMLSNTTSESWTGCKMMLSTNQITTVSGLNDAIPELVPWHVRLSECCVYENIVKSDEEMAHKTNWDKKQAAHPGKRIDRTELFGVGVTTAHVNKVDRPPLPQATMQPQQVQLQTVVVSGMLQDQDGGHGSESESDSDSDGGFENNEPPELAFQEMTAEEMGIPTTYDLPGFKTLVPGSTASKQHVARIAFSKVLLNHTVVAKYKPAAFLRAHIRNASHLTLLKGAVGLTLDGTFIGRTTLPRCNAGGIFSLNLGVDPDVRVVYLKPDVQWVATTGMSAEEIIAYTRIVIISNTRAAAGKAISLVVLDQVPVSEDKRLRVELKWPRGLVDDDTAVETAGLGLSAEGYPMPASKDWGTATATLKGAGEVAFDVTLNAGKTVRLDVGYSVTAPKGEYMIQC